MHSFKRYIPGGLILCVLLASYASSRAHLHAHSSQSVPFEQRDVYTYPSPSVLKAMSLNYTSFASSIHWVSALIYFGDWKYTKTEALPQHLLDYARTISELDPHFFNVYEWFNATYVASRVPNVSYDDLKLVESFMTQGIERFPLRYELPYTTGLLSLGFSRNRTDAQRLDEYERGIIHLQTCAKLKGCTDTVPFTVAYFYRQKDKYQAQLKLGSQETIEENRQRQIEFNAEIYAQTMDPALRERLADKLKDLGLSQAQVDALDQNRIKRFQRAYNASRTYLPLDLWTQVVYPEPDALALIPHHKENDVD